MGRTSKSSERIPQILDAFERSIIKHGLKGSSLPIIASEAGIKHSMIRHYIGNRDDLVMAMVSRFTKHYSGVIETALSITTTSTRIESALEYLFQDVSLYDAENIIFSELFAAATRDKHIRNSLMKLYSDVQQLAARSLIAAFPDTSEKKISSIVYALLCLWFGHTCLLHIGFGEASIPRATAAAKSLMSSLNE